MSKLADDGSDVVFVGLSKTFACEEKLRHMIIIIITIMILGVKVIS